MTRCLARVRTGTGTRRTGTRQTGTRPCPGTFWSGASPSPSPKSVPRTTSPRNFASEILGIRADDFAPTPTRARWSPSSPSSVPSPRLSRARPAEASREAPRGTRATRWTLKMRVRNRKTISPGYPVSRYGRLGRRARGRGWTGRAYPGEDGPSARRHRAQRRRRRRSSSTFRSRRTRRRDGDPPRATSWSSCRNRKNRRERVS